MKISFVEIQNFRKLKAAHIGFDDQTTLFVGANNSGKTSAMMALRCFLCDTKAHESKLTFRDITIENWARIDEIGGAWESGKDTANDLKKLLPSLDIWLDVPLEEIHHVVHILPTLEWDGGLLGVRLQYQPKKTDQLKTEFLTARSRAKEASEARLEDGRKNKLQHWPSSLTDFLSN